MQFFPQQQYGGFAPQQQQCSSCPGYNPGYVQPQQQYPAFSALYPQQYPGNPFQQQQVYYPQQQFYPQQQQFYPQQQQFYPQQQLFYPQQQQFYPQQQQFYPQQQQQQWPNWPQSNLGQNAYGQQQYWPQQQRVFEELSTSFTPVHHKKGESKNDYERYY